MGYAFLSVTLILKRRMSFDTDVVPTSVSDFFLQSSFLSFRYIAAVTSEAKCKLKLLPLSHRKSQALTNGYMNGDGKGHEQRGLHLIRSPFVEDLVVSSLSFTAKHSPFKNTYCVFFVQGELEKVKTNH